MLEERADSGVSSLVDAQLVKRFRDGDLEAFAVLHERYRGRVLAIARKRLRCPHDVEDVAQQVWMKVFQALPGYRTGRRSFEGWLVKVAQNSAEDYWRTERRTERWAPTEIDRRREATVDEPPEWGCATKIHAARADLVPLQREVLVLLYRWELGYARTSRVVGRDEATVRKIHSRALSRLALRIGRE